MSDLEKSIILIMEKTVNHWIDIFIHVNSKGENNVKENVVGCNSSKYFGFMSVLMKSSKRLTRY